MVSRDHVAHVVGTSQHGVGQLHDAVRRAPFVGVDQARLKGPLGWNARQRVPRDRRGGRPADRRPSRTADGTFRGGPSWADVLRAVRRRRPVWPPKACPASSVLPPVKVRYSGPPLIVHPSDPYATIHSPSAAMKPPMRTNRSIDASHRLGECITRQHMPASTGNTPAMPVKPSPWSRFSKRVLSYTRPDSERWRHRSDPL